MVNTTEVAVPCIDGIDVQEIVSHLEASAGEGCCCDTNQDRTGDLQGDAEDPQPSIRRSKRNAKKKHSQKKSSSTFEARSTEAFINTVDPTCNCLDGDLHGDEENTSEPPPATKTKLKHGQTKGNDTLQQNKWSTNL